MSKTHTIFLVPGFFGFANLGELYYFSHLVEFLSAQLHERGCAHRIVRVATHPTASIRHRARLLHNAIESEAGTDESIHIIGHSTGGLDARLFVSPGVSLGDGIDSEPLAQRVRNVVTVSTPHYGTPVATFFGSLLGQQLLRLLSIGTVYVLRFGRLPLSFVLKLGGFFTRISDVVGWREGLSEQLFNQLLEDFTAERRDVVQGFFQEVTDDQALLMQLTPDSMDLFNASTTNREDVAYASVVTKARPPSVFSRIATGLNAYEQAMHTIYTLMHRSASGMPPQFAPSLTSGQGEVLRAAYGRLPSPRANDGVVPTLSQPWGRIIDAANADHLDIIGHFDARRHDPPHHDWLATSSGYNRRTFERTWSIVVDFLLAE